MDSPRISVIITAYNYAHTLRTAIDSVFAQRYDNVEIIVLDNASIDATPQLMEAYTGDPRIRYVRNPHNIGMMANHNKGLRLATGDFIVFLSADDMLIPGHFRTHLAFRREHPEIDVSFSALFIVNEHGRIVQRRKGELPAAFIGKNNFFAGLLAYGCDMCMPTMLVPRRIYDTLGDFDETFISADYELFVRWAAAGVSFAYIPEALAGYRSHPSQQTSVSNYSRNGQVARDYLRILQKHVRFEGDERISGFELSVSRLLKSKFQHALESGYLDHDNLTQQVSETVAKLETVRKYNDAQPFNATFGVVVIANGRLHSLESSLQALVEQSYQNWEALVVMTDNAPLDGFFERIDPQGRIRPVMLFNQVGAGAALNTALCITAANCFTFMNSGTVYAADHLAKLAELYRNPNCRVAVSGTDVLMTDGTGQIYVAHDTLFDARQIDAVYVAPVYPLDALSFKRSAVDHSYYFNEDIEILHEWDLLIRLRNLFPITYFDSTVALHMNLNDTPTPAFNAKLRHTVEVLHKFFEVDHATVARLRNVYLAEIRAHCDPPTETFPTPGEMAYALRVIRGANALRELNPVAEKVLAYAS